MLSRRSSFKNPSCPVLKKSDFTTKPIEVASTKKSPISSSLPHSQSIKLTQQSNSFSHQEYGYDSVGHHDYGQNPHPLTRTQSTQGTQRTSSVGHQGYGRDSQPLPSSQLTKVAQRSNSVGHGEYGHELRATKLDQKSNSFSHQEYGREPQPTKLAQKTNSFGHHDYGRELQPTKLTQKTNSFGNEQQPRPHFQPTKVTQITNSVGHHEHEHGLHSELPKKAGPIIEFPVSPDLDTILLGEGITNANHPQHRMIHVNLPSPFNCKGCKEYGAGPRFTCQQCNFELHDFCALAPPVLKAHPLHSQHQLLFNPKPGKGGILRSKCDVCGKPTRGYLFHCSACSYQLHPCCAMLSAKMKFPIHPHPLVILPASANSLLGGDPGELPCAECKRKRSGQVYRCTVCDYYLHAVCAKSMVNGLHTNGIKGLEKPSVLGVAAKIATHVVVGFMGGLVEGLGEGLGEAITQNLNPMDI